MGNLGIPYDYSKQPLAGTVIMVNPGHGEPRWYKNKAGKRVFGAAPGTCDSSGKIFEKDLNDKVASNVARKLEKLGAHVLYVDNKPVSRIQELENIHKPDLFISIHHDEISADKKRNSGETVYAWGSSVEAAKIINKRFKEDSTIPNNKLSENKKKWCSRFSVLNADKSIPAVLVELGFLTNKHEAKILKNEKYQDKSAQFIVDGARDFLNMTGKTKEKNIQEYNPQAQDVSRWMSVIQTKVYDIDPAVE